ncbi:cdkn1a interacting zinc finger protein 1a isoform X2 [Triplophysa dalaica]|uniref:cdkn1a interacting zinc finger protein 1a isoform X2 n=1 Tax=Triplophysa dalaica TaxID=1582913 RepID=UPI0024E03678|nr:cdkn1a interacting zinc finger protein 1a isoform X2 [Triplophysa dalaica]
MFNPHQQQQQFHQHLRQLQQLFQQQTAPPPPPPPPPPQPPPGHHMSHHHQTARPMGVPTGAPPSAHMVNLCSATQNIMGHNPMLQGALLMQQIQASGMRGFAMGGQQFPQFFAPGSRASLLGPVPMGVAIKTPHMGYPRHFSPHARYFNNQDFQSRQPDRKREIEQKPMGSSDSQSEASGSRVDDAAGVADPGCPSTSDQPEEPEAKKQRTEGSEEPVAREESVKSAEYKSPDPEECTLQEGGSVEEPVAAEAHEQSQVATQMECTKPSNHDGEKQNRDVEDDATGLSTASDVPTVSARGPEEIRDATQETSNKFFCYICNITCHNQQNFQGHMNGLSHQQKMMEIQHMSNACLVTLLPRVQESLQGTRKDGEKRPGLQRWCSTCQTHFTSNVMEHRKTREHKCSRSSTSSCTVCKQDFTTAREFVKHMKTKEHKQRVEQLWRDSGKDGVEELNAEIVLGEEDDDISDNEREEDDDGKVKHEGLSAQMEVTLEDLTENEEFDADIVYGSSFVVPVAGFLCRLCNHFYHFESSARHAHCKTPKHFHNLKKYKASKKHEESASTSEPPADLIGPDKTIEPLFTSPQSLIPMSPLQTIHPLIGINRLSTSSLSEHQDHPPSSPNQQQEPEEVLSQTLSAPPGQSEAIAGEEPGTGEQEEEKEDERLPEEKAGRGRGRGAGKRRGRGGKRR